MGVRVAEKTQQLVLLAQQGDAGALDQLCRVYGERIRRIIRLRMSPALRSQLESMDLVQDALAAAVGNLDRFIYRDEGDFLRWLVHVAENRIRDQIDRIHAAKRDIRREVRLQSTAGNPERDSSTMAAGVVTTTPSVLASRHEELNRLELAMDRLKPEHREILVLAKIEGLPHKAISERLGISPAGVAKRIARAIVALAGEFETV